MSSVCPSVRPSVCDVGDSITTIIIIMEKTEAGLRGLCIREIDVIRFVIT